MSGIRKAAVAGRWYPGTASLLAAAVDGYLAAADDGPRALERLVAIVAPHAGLMYSGPVAAYAYRQLRRHAIEVAVLVGPSHFVGFDGVSIYKGGFETPFGVVELDEACASRICAAGSIVHEYGAAHAREHSLEMQLPFLKRVAPDAAIVPLVMGWQDKATAWALGDALGAALANRRALLVASTDLSHYHDAATAAALDRVVADHVSRLDADGLQRALDARPEHACGGGPTVAVIRAARLLGATDAVILRYADSGDVSGDKSAVVGYLAAAIGNFAASHS
ncbi:MAG: AmmeMemoRadiSam system protein B [Acidobacteria bacterium RIFCSPLOWO2_02_FULL_65_29]|nr:MAG: AmmeMemoRadiSam system protein B [Acidobacteria bacterium RIFCSPLOWO2_02_FULL_65_29]